MANDFYAAAIPEQRQLLGVPLRPLALGHLILLHRVHSSFVRPDSPPDYCDLALAALICSLSYEDGLQAISDPDTPTVLKKWADKITGNREFLVWIGFKKPRAIDLDANCKAFSDYIFEHSAVPNYLFKDEDFKTVDCPQVQMVRVSLMRDLHLSDSEIMNRSWALCLWDYITLKAVRGEITLIDREQIDAAKETGRQMAQLIKEGKIKIHGH